MTEQKGVRAAVAAGLWLLLAAGAEPGAAAAGAAAPADGEVRALWYGPAPRGDVLELVARAGEWARLRGRIQAVQLYQSALEQGAVPDEWLAFLARERIPVVLEAGGVKDWSPDGRLAAELLTRRVTLLRARGVRVHGVSLDHSLSAGRRLLDQPDEATIEGTRFVVGTARALDLAVGLIEGFPIVSVFDFVSFADAVGPVDWLHVDVDRGHEIRERCYGFWTCARPVAQREIDAALFALKEAAAARSIPLGILAAGLTLPYVDDVRAWMAAVPDEVADRWVVQSWWPDGVTPPEWPDHLGLLREAAARAPLAAPLPAAGVTPIVRTPDPLVGRLRTLGRSYGDETGPRLVYFCSWFPALRILRDDPETFYRQLNTIAAAGWQGVRIFTAVGGWTPFWDGREVAPVTFAKRDEAGRRTDRVVEAWPDYEALLREALIAFRDRGLKVHLTAGDLQILFPEAGANPSRELAHFERVARVAAEVGPEVVALYELWNEAWQNAAGNPLARSRLILDRLRAILPEVLFASSTPAPGEPPEAMRRWSDAADVATIHGARHPWQDAIAEAFDAGRQAAGEGHVPVWQGEPAGPDGSGPEVYLPIDSPDVLWGLYAAHLITGQASVFFNGPAVRYREPLESTWGFRELPDLYRHLPRDLGGWTARTDGDGADLWLAAASDATDEPARVEQVRSGTRLVALVSGGHGAWQVTFRKPLRYKVIGPQGVEGEGELAAGQAIPGLHGRLRARLILAWF